VLLGRKVGTGRAWEFGHGGLKRIAFPLLALLLVLVARPLAQQWMHVGLFSLALPLLGSMAVIRVVFYVLRLSLVGATWLLQFERVFAGLVWAVVALHITGLLPDVIAVLESVSFSTGKQKLTLWHLLQGIAAVMVTVLLALWLSSLIEARLNAATALDGNLRAVLARLSKALLILLAVLIGLPMVGIDLTTLSVFGGALGVGLGLGLQRIASNYVSGFIILLDNSIRIGNVISVGNDRGEVTRITTRYTVLRNNAGVEALVPNEQLVGSVVQNESYSDPKVRAALSVQVSYDSDLERAMAIMAEAASAQPRVLADPPPLVLLRDFADSGINLELGFWVADPEQGVGVLRSDINLAIWREFKRAGISIPFPQREVRVIKGEGIE
jgi:small-conductance mechanosensitive channel